MPVLAVVILLTGAFGAVLPLPAGQAGGQRAAAVITPLPTGIGDITLRAVDWNPVNDTALMAGDNGTILLYNSTAGFVSLPQLPNMTFRDMAFCPAGSPTSALLVGSQQVGLPLETGIALVYDSTGFRRLNTSAYKDIVSVSWDISGSTAYLVTRRGNDAAILAYNQSSGELSEVLTDPLRAYYTICRAENGFYLAGYEYDNQTLVIAYFDGASITGIVPLPGRLDIDAASISWSNSSRIGICAGNLGNEGTLLRFNSTGAAPAQFPPPGGNYFGTAWAHSRSLALVAGVDNYNLNETNGVLYEYNGTAATLQTSNRYYPLTDIAWHRSDKYALVTGENGTVLRYTVPNSPPWCAIISPRLGEVVNGTVNITGTAWDPDSDPIVSVQVRADNGAWQTADGGAGWSYRWETTLLANGAHTIWARSNDGLEDSAWAQTAVIVSNPDRPPAVSISGPSEGAAVQGMVSITGTSSDPDTGDTVTAVQVAFDGGQWSNASGTSVWNISWDTGQYQDGPHTIRARAHDGELYSQEAVRNVSVQNHGPDFPPSCTIGSPTSGSLVSGDVLVQGTAYDAENALRSVMVRADSGGWQTASGTASWSLLWDTRPLPGGAHTLTARAFDGVQNSSDVKITVQVGHQPVCSIVSPASGAVLSGELTIQGTASDPDPGDVITSVKLRIDSGDWATATGTASWTYRWNTSTGSAGQHVIRARCSDGTLESAEVSRTVTVEKPPAPVRLSEPTEAGEEYIILHWTTNTDPDFARYEVFSSQTEGAPLSSLSPRAVPAQSVTVYNYTGLASRTTYWFRVRVVDNSGQSSVSNEVFATTTRANIPPVAMLSASRIRAPVGESITFNAEGSYDRDGRITRYQWDFDGKGRFPLDTGPITEQRHQFRGAGRFLVQVKITDDRGATNTSSVEVTIFLPGGGGVLPSSLFLVALVAILVAGAVAFLYLRRPPPQESYYEHDVHRPAAERRKDFWPDDEEPAGRMKKVVKKRRV